MAFKTVVRPKLDRMYCSLVHLSELLKIPTESLLDAACDGKLKVFVHKPADVRLFTVHADALDLDGGHHFTEKLIRGVCAPNRAESEPIEAPPLEAEESKPWNMSESNIIGLNLTSGDCKKVRENEVFWQFLFASGVQTKVAWIEPVLPLMGHFQFREKRTLRPEGWSLACYGLTQPIEFHEGIGYSRPQGIEISLNKMYAAIDDINLFVDTLDLRNILAEYIENGHIVPEKLPNCISQKLVYLIEANQKFWHTVNPSQIENIASSKIEASRRYLMAKKFQALFDFEKGVISAGQAAFCRDAITPVFARNHTDDELRDWPTYLTPELLVMLVVAIRTWGGSRVRLQDVNSHPLTGEVVDLLRDMGIKGQDAKYAATIVRPESASRGRPVPKADPDHPFPRSPMSLSPKS